MFLGKLHSGALDEDLKYKYRDSYLYEWASGRADKPIDHLVLIALDTLDAALLANRTTSLGRQLPLRGPHGHPWIRPICPILRGIQHRVVESALPRGSRRQARVNAGVRRVGGISVGSLPRPGWR